MFVIIKEILLGKLVGMFIIFLGYFCIINYKYVIIYIYIYINEIILRLFTYIVSTQIKFYFYWINRKKRKELNGKKGYRYYI